MWETHNVLLSHGCFYCQSNPHADFEKVRLCGILGEINAQSHQFVYLQKLFSLKPWCIYQILVRIL